MDPGMNDLDRQDELISSMADLRENDVLALVKKRISDGVDPMEILDLCHKGMALVGERYEEERYFISGLIMAGEIMRQVGSLVLPLIESRIQGADSWGSILLGTAEGDIHFIGKEIFMTLARCNGFAVHDLGVDVPPSRFLSAARDLRPDIVGISCLITRAYDAMKGTISLLREGLQDHSPRAYIVGGVLDEQVFNYIGADFWTDDAMDGVRMCQRIMKNPDRR